MSKSLPEDDTAVCTLLAQATRQAKREITGAGRIIIYVLIYLILYLEIFPQQLMAYLRAID